MDYATARGLGGGGTGGTVGPEYTPKIVRICVQEVDQRGLGSEGIYRVCCASFHSFCGVL